MKSSNPKSIHEILKNNAISIKKRYGQNFLIDDNILKNIIALGHITEETLVIEIGPGLGSLTQYLVNEAKHVIAYEIDNDLIPILKNAFESEAFTLIHDDILKRNIDQDISNLGMQFDQVIVIANLPYYITTPILMKCLEESKLINRMVVMMQLEVARRLTANKNTKDYNALSVIVQYRANTKFGFKVPKNVFIPAPNVESGVITLDFGAAKNHNVLNETYFFECVKASFKQRRKTILNNLTDFFQMDKVELTEHLEKLNISPQSRAEALTLDEFVSVSNYFYKLLRQYL